jgi:lipoprotein-releasing system ATP-binding protein
MSKAIVNMKKVTKVFKIEVESVEALRGVTLSIFEGERVCVVGKSGAGKSTLLHIMGTLERPSGGVLEICGQDISKLNDSQLSYFRNRNIGFVFQMNNLLPEFSAIENVMLPGLISGEKKAKLVDRARYFLEIVGLGNRTKHRPFELSGGEQQRVAIARALILSPSLILADEPTGNLDKKNSELVQSVFFDVCQKMGASIVVVTHDDELSKKFTRKIVMEDGLSSDFQN